MCVFSYVFQVENGGDQSTRTLGGMIMSMCAYYHHDLLSGKWEKINPREVRGGFIKIK